MADTMQKIEQLVIMITKGDYFTINRPRQYGKTTTIHLLETRLSSDFLVISTSFEGVGDDLFNTEEAFCSTIFKIMSKSIRFKDKETSELLLKRADNIKSFFELSESITIITEQSHKKIILLIDEVDKSSNSKTFLQFLGLLRNKYTVASIGNDITFHSVILAGIHDIKNLKLAIRDENEARFNSPWNIAAKFDLDMSLSAAEIATMLMDYQNENQTDMDIHAISSEIYDFTSGYPYLVSDICKTIDESLDKDFSINGVYNATKQIMKEKNTLFDDLIKNIENNEEIKTVVYELLVEGSRINYDPYTFEKGIMYGIFRADGNKLVVHNKIYQELIYSYLTEQENIRKMASRFRNVDESQFIKGTGLDMEKIMLKFQEFMAEEYRHETGKFYETYGRLIFLAYLKPIINGKGFSFVEPQTRENKRMDIVIVYGPDKYVVELKIWRGEKFERKTLSNIELMSAEADKGCKYEEAGLNQLADYMRIQKVKKGYLIIFDAGNTKKEDSAGWKDIGDRKVFEVIC